MKTLTGKLTEIQHAEPLLLDDREVRRIEFSITSEDGNPYTQLYTLAGDGTAYD